MLSLLAWEWYKHISSQISAKIIENRLSDLYSLQYISNCSRLVMCFKQSVVLPRRSTLIDHWKYFQKHWKISCWQWVVGFFPVTARNLKCRACYPSLPKLNSLHQWLQNVIKEGTGSWYMLAGRCLIEHLYENLKKFQVWNWGSLDWKKELLFCVLLNK